VGEATTQSKVVSSLGELHQAVLRLRELADAVAGTEPESDRKEQMDSPPGSLSETLALAFSGVEKEAVVIGQCVERIWREMQPFGLKVPPVNDTGSSSHRKKLLR